jgi:hypothetical protein
VLLLLLLLLLSQSVYGIARTLFLVCLLGLGSFLIHADTYRCDKARGSVGGWVGEGGGGEGDTPCDKNHAVSTVQITQARDCHFQQCGIAAYLLPLCADCWHSCHTMTSRFAQRAAKIK